MTLIQYETRDDPYLNALMALNKSYCVKRGYNYLRVGSLKDMPHCWIKVNLSLMVLRGAEDGDIVCWLNSDAVIVDTQSPIEDLFREAEVSKYFLASRDPKPWKSPFNAGVFIVKANGVSRRVMEDWMDIYQPSSWQQLLDGSWKCKGENYEQGAFSKYILTKNTHAIQIFDSDKFACTTPAFGTLRPNGGRVFSCHFADAYKKRIPDLLEDNMKGTGKVRPVGLVDGSENFLSKNTLILVFIGVVLGAVVIFAFTKKESQSPAASLINSAIRFVKRIKDDVL